VADNVIYDVTFVWLKWSELASDTPEAQDILFASTCWCVDAVKFLLTHVKLIIIDYQSLNYGVK